MSEKKRFTKQRFAKQQQSGPHAHGVPLKKQFGQHFLRDESVVAAMLARVPLDANTSVFEIGCGDGFLTKALVAAHPARLWVFEIDPEWAALVREKYADERTSVFVEDILSVDWQRFAEHQPWVLLANLPYQISFPLLQRLAQHASFLREGVIMVQEEVAQRLVATRGRSYGFQSLFFQHVFHLELLDKVPPTAFFPPPKVNSRLVYFKPLAIRDEIPMKVGSSAHPELVEGHERPCEEQFWLFIRRCFSQPRRTIKNNLAPFYNLDAVPVETLGLRAQQMDKGQFLSLWKTLQH